MPRKPEKIVNPGGLHVPAYGTPVPGGEGRFAGLVIDPADPRGVFVRVEGGPDVSVSEWDARVERERWRVYDAEALAAASSKAKTMTKRKFDAVDDLRKKGKISVAEVRGARVMQLDFTVASSPGATTMRWWQQRVDGGGGGLTDAERRLFHKQRYDAAMAHLGADPEERLHEVARMALMQGMSARAVGVELNGTQRHSAAGHGTAMVQLVLHRLVRFYGLLAEEASENSTTHDHGFSSNQAA